jgi:hypothetical protein
MATMTDGANGAEACQAVQPRASSNACPVALPGCRLGENSPSNNCEFLSRAVDPLAAVI